MKNLILIFIASLFISCQPSPVVITNKYIEPVKTIDKELGQRIFLCDSTVNVRDEQIKTIRDSLQQSFKKNDSLKANLFLANYKIEKVRFYLGICLKNSSQDRFLKGWVKRAIN